MTIQEVQELILELEKSTSNLLANAANDNNAINVAYQSSRLAILGQLRRTIATRLLEQEKPA